MSRLIRPFDMPSFPNAQCAGTEPTAALCARCWDRRDCLAWALAHEDTGYWAGQTQASLRKLREEFGITLKPIIGFQFALAGN